MPGTIDLNADVGESFGRWSLGDDAGVLAAVTSANVACGFHAGDPRTLLDTCALAHRRGVRIGAQVGYRDLAGFGRRFIDVEPADLRADVLYQVGALRGLAQAVGSAVTYVKPHGALYHALSSHPGQRDAVVDACAGLGLPLVLQAGSRAAERAAAAGVRVVREGFADRRYAVDGALVPRTEPGAVLTDPEAVCLQAVDLARSGGVDTICLHGDTAGAADLASRVRSALIADGTAVQAFS